MRRLIAMALVIGTAAVCLAHARQAPGPRRELAPTLVPPDAVESVTLASALADTNWIANWHFDLGTPCDDTGWQRFDLRARNDGSLFWSLNDRFSGRGRMSGRAAVLGQHDLCWEFVDGYDNDWYQAIRLEFVAPSFLSFDFLLDSEPVYDYLQVEVDSGCTSFDRIDFERNPADQAANYRRPLWTQSGFDTLGVVDSLALGDEWTAGSTHCAYISFLSDRVLAPSDGRPSILGIAVAIDNLNVSGATALSEDFEGPLDPRLSFANLQDSAPFGEWGRVYQYITDNDPCTSNLSCAWLWTDHTTPTIANRSDMAFSPGGYVIKNWLDNVIVSPWISWSSAPGVNTILSFRRFPGNLFSTSRIVQNWSVRGRYLIDDTDSPTPGDSVYCETDWGHRFNWNSLSTFEWRTETFNITAHIDPRSRDIQIRFRVSDWQFIGGSPPSPLVPGPGPFIDDVRIGRAVAGPRVFAGPRHDEGIDSRSQAQDAFPTFRNGLPGEHFSPSQTRFGTAAFSRSGDLGINGTSPNLITGDSIHVQVADVEDAGGIVSVQLCATIVIGPHTGKAPPPWSVWANGFFAVPADSARDASGQVVANDWFVDLDDDYFRGGDRLLYFWLAEDALGHKSSDPTGLAEMPPSIEEAVTATGGLLEVTYLPKVDWSLAYLLRIAADPHGKLEPTPEELANSEQATCILYVQCVNTRRRSTSRTSFMYTLDALGYKDLYDVYDLQGLGNTNNQLGGRASVAQATGYAVIVFDAGALPPGAPIMPDGVDLDSEKIDQNQWFRNWLAQATVSEAGQAALWIIGSNAFEEKPLASLYTQDMGIELRTANQGLGQNPAVQGVTSFTFHNETSVDFTADNLVASPLACGEIANYDGLADGGNAVATHYWVRGTTVGDASIIMNTSPAQHWSTIAMAFPWSDLLDPQGLPAQESARERLAAVLLDALLMPGCAPGVPSSVGPGVTPLSAPRRTALDQNHPNPFNPTTTIRFDLASGGVVELRIYDVTGRLVRTLVDEVRQPARHRVVWDGRDDAARPVPTGIYFARLHAGDYEGSRKLVVLR